MRLVQIRNKVVPLKIIPEVSIRRTKLIDNQVDPLGLYIASIIPSEIYDLSTFEIQ